MILIHTPAGGEPERYDTNELSAVESGAVERVTGLAWDEIEKQLLMQSPTAMLAVLWVWHKRRDPSLRFGGFDVPGWKRRLKVRQDAEEIAELVEAINEKYTDPDERARALRELEQLADDPTDVQEAAQGPKPLPVPAASTPGS